MEELIGVIKLFGGNFAPQGFMECNGQLLPINQYQGAHLFVFDQAFYQSF